MIELADEIQELRSKHKAELIEETMSGRGNYWNNDPRSPDCYDHEQAEAVLELVQRILAMPTISDATRWQVFKQMLRDGEVAHYAKVRTRE